MRHLRTWSLVLAMLVAGVTSAQAQSCTDDDLQAATDNAGRLTTLLRIANFRGDLKYMGEVAGELEQYLATCGDDPAGRLPLVCGYDCHLQLARYRLFLAANLPFLSTAGTLDRGGTILSPQEAQRNANEGIAIAERGLKFLARQQGGGEGAQAEASFRTFTQQLVGLNAVKIRLFMSTGDAWYQTMSEARVKALSFAVTSAIEAGSGAGLESQPNLHKAHTQYQAALWSLIETSMDIPGETTYDDLRAEILLLENDLQARLHSVERGFLFLNLDPDAFTTIPFEELQQRLAETSRDIAEIESRIEAVVRAWSAALESQANRDIDERRTVRSQQINLIAHQIGKIEQEAQVFANDVRQEIQGISADRDTFAHRQNIRQLEIALATKIAEFENRRSQIEGRQELDLIVLSKEAEVERRNELRWLLNFEMTRMNLDLQVSSINSQINEYERQIARNMNQREQLDRQRQILATQISNAEAGIGQALADIELLEIRRSDLFEKKRRVMRTDICNVESQLAFIGESPATPFVPLLPSEEPCDVPTPSFTRTEYVANMCGEGGEPGLRGKLLNAQIQARAFTVKCVVGAADFSDLQSMVEGSVMISADATLAEEIADVDCGAFTQTETDFAKAIYEAEKEMLQKQEDDFNEAKQQVIDQLNEVQAWFVAFEFTTQSANVILTIAEATYATATLVPVMTTAVAGMSSGVYTEIDAARTAKATVEAARSVLSSIISAGRVTQQHINQINQLNQQIDRYRQQTEQIDYQRAIKAVALHRTHFQLAGQRADGLSDIKELTLQNSMAAVECESQELGIDEQVSRLTADHARLLASMDLQARENDLVDFEFARQQGAIERFERDIDVLSLEMENVALSDFQLAADTTRIDELIDAAQQRIERVEQTRGTITALADESQAATNLINELRERQSQQMLALSDEELGFVEARIRDETSNTETLVAELNNAIGLSLKNNELEQSITQFQAETLARVSEQQEEMTALVSQIDDPAERSRLFIASQETLAELLEGIPDYIDGKRRSLATANRLLHLMRQRYTTVHAFTGDAVDFPSTYVTTGAQLDQLVDDIVNRRFFDERQINIDVARVVVPSNSGFMKRLALTDAVEFEISPFAQTEAEMRELGYFVLWDREKFRDRKNMSLIDVLVGTQYQCTGSQWNRFSLEHMGSGSIFRPLAEGSDEMVADIVTGPRRLSLQTFYNLADSEDDLRRVVNYWLFDRFQVRKFPRQPGPPNDPSAVLPFLGAPLISTYRIGLHPSDCPFDGAVFTVYFIFASAP
ncbi:hypothetical protein [Thetidibacter halocola]|uniref:Uncharacterized protein n=1 Tax=Thetidibacter halocola TaxID=2827239 RepID=A0A8J7WHF3_9RHOB|nr:hypothetical protein [Thetidibacter halocola]MBS0125393.1 hypothetical protein [Thetidibacter halocola]